MEEGPGPRASGDLDRGILSPFKIWCKPGRKASRGKKLAESVTRLEIQRRGRPPQPNPIPPPRGGQRDDRAEASGAVAVEAQNGEGAVGKVAEARRLFDLRGDPATTLLPDGQAAFRSRPPASAGARGPGRRPAARAVFWSRTTRPIWREREEVGRREVLGKDQPAVVVAPRRGAALGLPVGVQEERGRRVRREAEPIEGLDAGLERLDDRLRHSPAPGVMAPLNRDRAIAVPGQGEAGLDRSGRRAGRRPRPWTGPIGGSGMEEASPPRAPLPARPAPGSARRGAAGDARAARRTARLGPARPDRVRRRPEVKQLRSVHRSSVGLLLVPSPSARRCPGPGD